LDGIENPPTFAPALREKHTSKVWLDLLLVFEEKKATKALEVKIKAVSLSPFRQ